MPGNYRPSASLRLNWKDFQKKVEITWLIKGRPHIFGKKGDCQVVC